MFWKRLSAVLFALSLNCAAVALASAVNHTNLSVQDDPVASPSAPDPSKVIRQLTSRDPLERQRAAEELARLALPEHRRLAEGYRLQEKNSRVRVAYDWALYRMGKREALFDLVRALDTSRSDQAQVYLSELETPEPLYLFLERANGNTQIKLLQILAYNGDAQTLERLKAYSNSIDPKIAEAARAAERDISERLASPASAPARARQRQISEPEETTP